jgi:glycosyltransferase involved in cell wall biosynthesis
MDMNMAAPPQIALIFTQYNAPDQPYLTNWVAGLRPQGFSIKIFSNNKVLVHKPPTSVFEIDAPPGKLGTAKYFARRCAKNPWHFIKWFFQEQDLSTKDKIQIWARYAPLLVSQPEVIHLVNSSIYPRYDLLINKLKSISIISFRGHDTVVKPLVDDQWRKSLKKIFSQCDYLHYVSNYLRQEGINLGAPAERSFVIYPGIDVNFYKPSYVRNYHEPERPLTLITVGRLVWQKGLISALKAVKALAGKNYNIQYSIVGDGVERDHLAFRARELGIENNVKFFGTNPPDKVKQLLASADIFLQPSITEAIPVAGMEAGAMELPVIASNVGGLPELVEHDVTGLLVPPDNPAALAEAIMALSDDKDKSIQMGKQAREKAVRDFSLEREVKEWLNFYENALN